MTNTGVGRWAVLEESFSEVVGFCLLDLVNVPTFGLSGIGPLPRLQIVTRFVSVFVWL